MSRAIDAVQALNNINWHHRPTPVNQFDSGFNQGLNQAMWEITHAPTLTPPNEWVSVEKALPPEHETVLCIVSGKPKSNITLEDAYQLGSWNKADGWIIVEWLDWEGANVTWWMKLPESPDRRPPEGKEGDADRG